MKLFKNLFMIAVFGTLATITSRADTATYFAASDTNLVSVIQRGARINSISIANAAAAAVTLRFFDTPTNVTTYVVGAYTNRVLTTPSTVTTFTNIYGVIQSSTNTTFTLTDTAVGASTNSYRTLLTQVVPASSTVTITPPLGMYVGFGLSSYATATNVTATINYVPVR